MKPKQKPWRLKSRWYRPQPIEALTTLYASDVKHQEECYRRWKKAKRKDKHLWVPA